MTREETGAELAQINVKLHAFARGGVVRTKEDELERARLHARKAELEAAWTSAPVAAAANPHEAEMVKIQAEMQGIRHQVDAMLAGSRPITLSAEMQEAERARAYSDRMQALNNRLATLQAATPPAPSPQPVVTRRAVSPSDFPRAVSPAGSATGEYLLQQLGEGQAIQDVTTEAAVRDGRFGKHREEVYRRLGLPVPDDRRTGALVGVPVYGARAGGNGLGSPAVQAHIVARGKRLW